MTHDFRALHRRGDPVILPNAWDAGAARILEGLGARALATTSAGHAFSCGRVDGGTTSRDAALAHAEGIVAAVRVPVSADLENGFGAAPEDVADTVRLAAEAGLAGGSIEDTDLPGRAPYAFDMAVERIRAAAAAARALPGDFMLVARADGVLLGAYDVDEAIRRVRAFEAAGADCVYVPGPADMAALRGIVASVTIPVNVLAAGPFAAVPAADFAALGAARITVGGALSRVAYGAAARAGHAILQGDFSALSEAMPEDQINRFFTG